MPPAPSTPSDTSLTALVRDAAFRSPDKLYLSDGSRHLTFGEAWQQIETIAANLQVRGIGHGDRVVIVTENRIESVLLFFATIRAGGIAVILHPQLKPEGLHRVIDQTKPKLGLLEASTASLSAEFGETPVVWAEQASFEALLAAPKSEALPFPGQETDPAFLVFTSGSTGTPRGVILTHAVVRFVSAAIQARLQYQAEDRVAVLLPLSFDYGLYQLFYAAIAGASVFIGRPEMAGPELPRILAAQEISVLPGVPTLFGGLIKMQRYRPVPLPKIRVITNTGDHLPQSYIASLRELFPQARIYPMYGLTEAFRSTYLPPELVATHPESMGRAIPHAEILVCRPDGSLTDDDEPGELVHCGPLVAQGYWNDPIRTAERFRPAPPSSSYDGRAVWSGDTVRRDAEGLLYFVGREDAMIKSAGNRISPTEVEEAAQSVEGVAEAVALGVPDARLGQAVLLLVRIAEGHAGVLDALHDYLKKELPNFMMPVDILVVDQFPRNPNGKIDRVELANNWGSLTEGQPA